MLESRLLSILMLLQTRGRMTALAPAKEFEVSVRTIPFRPRSAITGTPAALNASISTIERTTTGQSMSAAHVKR
jgi:hypothetical protein